jgi:hypothetical protein
MLVMWIVRLRTFLCWCQWSAHCYCDCCCCRGSYDLTGRVYASGTMGVPMCLNVLSGDSGERVVYGDTKGCATLLLCGSRELPARDLISTEQHKVRQKHGTSHSYIVFICIVVILSSMPGSCQCYGQAAVFCNRGTLLRFLL